MPVPKGVDPKKYDDCVDEVKQKQGKKVNAYAVCASSLKDAKKSKKDMKKAMVDVLSDAFQNEKFNEEEVKMEIKKALTSTSGEGANAPVVTPSSEVPTGKIEAAPSASATTPEATAAAPTAPTEQPKLAPGMFQGFALGATLRQSPTGNVMTNMKKPMMDYEKTYQNSTKNQRLTPEQLTQVKPTTPNKK